MIETSVAFSEWLVTRTTGVSAKRNSLAKILKISYNKAKTFRGKVSCSYQTDLLLSNSSAYGIEENREAARFNLASLAVMKTL